MTFRQDRAFILITALWTLAFLTVLAVTLLSGVRQRIILFQRLEDRSRAQLAVEAGVKKSIAILLDDMENSQFKLTAQAKVRRMNNPGEFANILVGDQRVEVVHEAFDDRSGEVVTLWGLADEQAKINLNTAASETIKRLIVEVLGWGGAEAKGLADAITDWRDYGQHEAQGFFSDDYYKNLEFPYAMKEQPFERLDELLLVKGIDRKIYEGLLPFVTVYGDGRVNINTASRKVLVAMGLDAGVADKVLKARRGTDNVEATGDDHIFSRTFDVASETARAVILEAREARQIDELNAKNFLTTESGFYSLTSRVLSSDGGYKRTVMCVFSAFESRVVYWYEK
jgi:type II secretory pathway component PulK